MSFFRKDLTVKPREAMSAGLLTVLTYLRCSACETLAISETLLATKVRNLVVLLSMYLSTELLSVQNMESACSI